MSWLGELDVELGRVGIRGGDRRRILAELADHLACEPESETRLGSPRQVAERFVAELGLARTRRVAWTSFAVLALTACLLATSSLATSAAGRWPDLFGVRGLIVALAGLAIVVPAQVAFVAGVLALVRRPRDVSEARLVQRRIAVALVAGATVATGELVQAVAMRPLRPSWWFAVALAAGIAPLAALAPPLVALRGARLLTSAPVGQPPGFAADLPAQLRPYVRGVAPAVGATAVLAMALGSAVVERSLVEGLSRGVLEGIAFIVGFVVLGRLLGLHR